MSSLPEPPEGAIRHVERYHCHPFRQPEAIDDPLSELAREGARRMLAQVLIAEADSFVAVWKDLKLPDGRDRVVRHGHGPHRAIQTGVGPLEVRRAKVRDRGDAGAEVKIRFSALIMAWSIAFLGNIKTYPTHLARLDQQPYDRTGWACVTGANGR